VRLVGIVLAFTSDNTALAPHPNKAPADALVRNMKAELLRSMCRSRSGTYGNNTCFSATVSADGLWGAFTATTTVWCPTTRTISRISSSSAWTFCSMMFLPTGSNPEPARHARPPPGQ
jgi:hypothetical protein